MAVYRNCSNEELTVGVGLRSPRMVAPDETIEVDDDTVENYDLNANFVRVDGGSPRPPAVDAPAVSANAGVAEVTAEATGTAE